MDGVDYKPAILLIKDRDGTVISRKILDVPCARFDSVYLHENKTNIVYLFTLDYSTGWGSYNGPVSYFVHFTDTGMATYTGENGFAETLKSAWAMRYSHNHLEVWSKMCRPSDNADSFFITTKKCVWNADSFQSVTKVKPGYWDDERDDTTLEGTLKQYFDSFSD